MLTLAFAGTPGFAAHILEQLLANGYRPKLVLTQPDRRAGRGRRMVPSAVKQAALKASLPVATPAQAAAIQPALASRTVDVLVVAAYGLLLPAPALAQPRFGCINVHPSLLPRWRGAAPIERALLAGDTETGVSIMRMDRGLDTGPVFKQARMPIGERTTGQELENALAQLGAELLLATLPKVAAIHPEPQSGAATLAPKLGSEDSKPDWRRSARDLDRQIRALAHRMPVAATLADTRVQILSATPREQQAPAKPGVILESAKTDLLVACGSGALALDALRVSRGKGTILGPADARNGFPNLFFAGARLQ